MTVESSESDLPGPARPPSWPQFTAWAAAIFAAMSAVAAVWAVGETVKSNGIAEAALRDNREAVIMARRLEACATMSARGTDVSGSMQAYLMALDRRAPTESLQRLQLRAREAFLEWAEASVLRFLGPDQLRDTETRFRFTAASALDALDKTPVPREEIEQRVQELTNLNARLTTQCSALVSAFTNGDPLESWEGYDVP